jgi:hypothetical protein
MSEIPALDTLLKMSEEFKGKSEEEILDIIVEKTPRLNVNYYNNLPLYEKGVKDVGLYRVKDIEKYKGDFVQALKCEQSDSESLSIQSAMYLLVDD